MQGFGPTPYLLMAGTAREALEWWASVFGGAVSTHTFEQFGRTDGDPNAVAHGTLTGPVSLYAADAGTDDAPFASAGLFFALLGTGSPEQSKKWFDRLSEGGHVIDALQQRGWNAWDGQVRDRYGVTWLVGYELDSAS
ncbi:VOC family protein [Curtobacterium ammoniigenes]|uniref:VOC family protein n=1 Tax=Curtobacterium ammoniigenes TaxID=395387 RepID=UPI00082ABAFD|nr:VOC family protein [Curtobacterium ammoniigenes]